MLNGSEITSNSRYDGMDLQKSTTPGKMRTALMLMMDPMSWEKAMMISI